MLTAVTCWLFWLCCYMTYRNLLIGPKLSITEKLIIVREWGNEIKDTMDVVA
ncbi:VhaM9.7-b [Drosophila busckii]|uniref:VhaM9.7-b n=1 Tax=Drosophila busckii TaxID=30019 RepID=A0A0M4EA56_DROBS|nr:VhaM9.7-b [Drosophila busckii]